MSTKSNFCQCDRPSIHQLFEEQVEQTPDAIALVFEDEQLTYGELNRRANLIAHYLQQLGVGPEVLVGICVERSLSMVVGILGILKAGGAYLPLDPTYPQERLAFMLQDAQASVMLTQQSRLGQLPLLERVICLDTDWSACQDQENLECNTTADNLAYVIYTSGSTGQPKGVMVPHGAVMRLVLNTDYVSLQPSDVIAQVSNISFDAATFEIWGALLNGASLVIINTETVLSPREFAHSLRTEGITTLFLTTALFNQMVQSEPLAFQSLRLLLFGGEAVDPRRVRQVLESGAPQQLLHVYGPTENTTFSTWYCVEQVEPGAETIPIGRPIANTQTYILDHHLQPVPIGVPGELYVGGAGLAREYLNRPQLTAERFIANPFVDGERLYKTGDLVRYLPDGNIEFLGRIDLQVKIRGFRIEPGEIESVLNSHPAVQQAVVIDREDVPGQKRLIAYLVPKQVQHDQLSAKSIRAYLSSHLPDYMVPAAFVTISALPLTANGKIDRLALPTPSSSRNQLEEDFMAPRTPVEEVVAGIWAQVLGLARVGVRDNFLELGGHSLLAIQIISRVRDTFQVELSLRSLFEAPTVAQLAQHLETARRSDLSLHPPITPVSLVQELPLSFAQEQLWLLYQLNPDTPVYNEPLTIRLTGWIDVTALEQSLNAVIRRHEVLRTTFSTVNGQPVQVIHPAATLKLPVVDLQVLPSLERETEALRIATLEARKPFDLTSGPLLRATLIQLSEVDYRLFLTQHHIIDDAISAYNVLLPELETLYKAFCAGKPSPLSELPIQFADFAVWQRQWLQGEVLERHVAYWQQQLANLPVLQLPTDRPRPAVQTFRGARECIALSKTLTEALKTLSRQQGVTLFTTLLAAFKTLLYRYTGQEEIVIGTFTAGRNRPELENLIGFFLNTLVLRTYLSGNPSFAQLLKRLEEVTLAAYAHEELPFKHLMEIQPRNLSYNPLFQVAFVLEPSLPPLDSGWTISQLDVDTGTAKFDLSVELEEKPDGIIGRFEYNTDLFDTATINRMIGHFQTLLEAIVANPIQPLMELPMLTSVEQQQLLVEWNDTQVDSPSAQSIHSLFESQVQHTPDAVAVVYENQQLTYSELNNLANQLAHYLRSMGVGAEVLVGICVERSLFMVVGILGILKAGGAYVPLDPEYPSTRLGLMLEDAQVSVLLTQQHLVKKLPESKAQCVCLDTEWHFISQSSEENPITSVQATNLAYVIYTSGSTGQPKGVLVAHRNLVHSTCAHISYYQEPVSRFLLVSSLTFDTSVAGIFWTLCCGGTLVLPQEGLQREVPKLVELIHQNHISHLLSLPSLYALILQQAKREQLASLHTIIVAGESCPSDLVKQHQEYLPSASLFNEYGPTEGTVWSSVYLCQSQELTRVPIGRPIANTQIYILDSKLRPVPVGVPGELHISGVGVARGYLNRPELTLEKFIPNPFSDDPLARLYKTGDKARYLPDGNIEYIGRIDHQVKIRGYRIELGEIETVLSQHPKIQQVVVVVRSDSPGDKSLTAYIVPAQTTAPTIADLRHFLKQQLPDYMVPSVYVILDALPLLPNGKVDRRALPASEGLRLDLEAEYVAPRTLVEEMLAKIWAEVLGLEKVGIDDNFFDLGGHSLKATRVLSRVQEAFQVELLLHSFFEEPTIAKFSQVIEKTKHNDPVQASVIKPVSREKHRFRRK